MPVLYTHTVYKAIYHQRHKVTEWRLGDFDKQTVSSEHTHSHTQCLRDGQLCKYARPLFLGSPNTTANISPAVISFIFSAILIGSVPSEVARGFQQLHGMASNCLVPPLPPGGRCWLRRKVAAGWDATCPLGRMKCRFCNLGSFGTVWNCLIGPDWRLIWLA